MGKRVKRKLDIIGYPDNAANNFSWTRLIAYTVFSIILSVLLIITTIGYQYEGKALTFSIIGILLIVGYSILNILAIIKKIRN